MQTEYRVTLSEIYPYGFDVPAKFELTGEFRLVKEGERFLSIRQQEFGQKSTEANTVGITPRVDNRPDFRPRLILRKAKTRVITFRSTGETRLPVKGEWYCMTEHFFRAEANHKLGVDYPQEIFTRTETEE